MNLPLFLAQINLNSNNLIQAVVWIVVAALVYFILNWAITKVGLPEPFNKIATVIIVLIAVIMLINGIFMLTGHAMFNWH
jgi:hypothetical protein